MKKDFYQYKGRLCWLQGTKGQAAYVEFIIPSHSNNEPTLVPRKDLETLTYDEAMKLYAKAKTRSKK